MPIYVYTDGFNNKTYYANVICSDIDNIINDFYIQNKHGDEIRELDESN